MADIKVYKLISLSINLRNKLFLKKSNPVFSTEVFSAAELEDAEKRKFLYLDEKLSKKANKDAKAKAARLVKEQEKPADEKPADEEPADEEPADEKPADEEPADEKPADEEPADEKPADEEPADEKPADEDDDLLPKDMPGYEELIANQITSYKQLDEVEDLTSLTGIGIATANKIKKYIAENN